MNMLTISCPSCGFSRQVPADRVPEGERKVTCPQCKASFQFHKPAAGTIGVAQPPVPQPPPLAQPQQPQQPQPQQQQPQQQQPQQQQPQQQQPQQQQPQKQQPWQLGQPQGEGRASGRSAPKTSGSAASRRELSGVPELFKESWQVFQRRFPTLFGLFLLGVAGLLLPAVSAGALATVIASSAGKVAAAAVVALGAIGSVYAGFRCFAAFLHAVADERLGLKDALAQSGSGVCSLIWVWLLSGFVISGGFMLLVVPGVIFMVWFCFAQFVVIGEGTRGMGALLKSREYVRGEWFNVALRLLLVWAVSLLVGAVPVAGAILAVVFLPYVTIFHYLIYRDLRALKGQMAFGCGFRDKAKWPAVALAGYLVVPLVLVSVLGVSLLGPLGQLASKQGVVLRPSVSAPQPDSGAQDYRVITFPESSAPAPETPAGQSALSPPAGVAGEQQGEEPEDVSIFIYAVNYTGTVKANGTVIRELEGKPEMQYNYNMGGRSLRYGANQIEIDFAELPSHQQSLLGVHMRVSRTRPGKEREVLGEWKIEDKGRGTRTFNLDIPR